jgi:hypothetical protein
MFWLVLAGIGVFIYIGNLSNPTGPPRPASGPMPAQPAQQAAAPPPAKPYIPPPPADLPVLAEVRPAGGVNPILSVQEILYCLSEEIRMDTMQAILTDPSQGQINSFNARVGDFNARCTAYRYRNNDMDRAKTVAASRKSSLQAEAQRIVSGWR